MLVIRLTPDMEARLNSLAKKTRRTKTFYTREAINRFMDEREDFYLTDMIARKIEAGEMTTHSLDDVVKQFGLRN